MFFLQELYNVTEALVGDWINHFYLIELIFFSLDRSLLYFMIWLIGRFLYLRLHKDRWPIRKVRREVILNGFVFYILLLIHLTVFRGETTLSSVTIHLQPLSVINWVPFVETIKLTNGLSMFSYYYNLYGNILWFVPMGFGAAYLLSEKHSFLRTLSIGFFVSLSIEVLQYLFDTGITDIDDLIFNTVGTIIGILLFQAVQWIHTKRKRVKKDTN
ncbi:VanZ family protein [Desemzia sp. RIT804]|uniref:VanZ family protein n=1 Tax=Desemzia sp. RIT 804 TaxID=2810209 RepID=UPI0019529D4F|nr:VanZ family protein [Desemzia sp. RIT 804]